jgi:hypothetical protein
VLADWQPQFPSRLDKQDFGSRISLQKVKVAPFPSSGWDFSADFVNSRAKEGGESIGKAYKGKVQEGANLGLKKEEN